MPPVSELRLGVVLFENTPAQVERLTRSLALCRECAGTPPFHVAWLDHSTGSELRGPLERLDQNDYRHTETNAGFGAGHNVLMTRAFEDPAVGAYVSVNPDSVLHPACLSELAREWLRQPKPGLVEARQFPDEHPKTYDPLSHRTPWCAGCVLLVTRSLHEAIGGFDERFFLYCEDVDYSWRARGAGFGTFLAPRALVHHYADARGPERDPRLQMLESGAYLARKYGDRGFEDICAREYWTLGGRSLVVPNPDRVDASTAAVADFSHGFSFAEARW